MIDKSKINVTLPDGIERVSDFRVKGDTVEFDYTATKPVTSVEIKASYDGGEEQKDETTAVPEVAFTDLKFSPETIGGQIVTLTATFDSTPHIELYKAEVTGAEETEAPKVSGTTIVSKYKLPKKDNVEVIAKVSYNVSKVKEAKTMTVHPTQIWRNMEITPAEVKVGEDFTIICTYTKDTTEFDKPDFYKVPEGVTEKTPAVCEGNTIKIVYTANTEGKKAFFATAYEGLLHETTRTASVTVSAATVLKQKAK